MHARSVVYALCTVDRFVVSPYLFGVACLLVRGSRVVRGSLESRPCGQSARSGLASLHISRTTLATTESRRRFGFAEAFAVLHT